ncbi:MAG: GerAB/ArcD/ProY family transporter [Bacillota bacterium]
MNGKNAKISPAQFMLLMASFIVGSSLLLWFTDNIAKQDAWLVIATAFVVSIPFILSYAFLAKRFPGKSLIQISDIIYGPVLGKLISILYISYFLFLLSLNMLDLADFYMGFIMPETPTLVFLTVFGIICAYAVRKGIETIARISVFSLIYAFIVVAVTFLLLLGNIDLDNFLPMLQLSVKDYIQSTHIVAAIPFCEVAVFLMVFPSLNTTKKAGKYTMGGFAVAAFTLLLISVRDTAVLGPSAAIYSSAAYAAARLINIGEVLTRIEILVALGITVTLFIKVCVLFYASVTSVEQLFRVRSSSRLIVPIGIIAVVIAMSLFDSIIAHRENGALYHAIYALPFEFIIPPLSLLIAKIRKLPKTTAQ